MNPYLFLKTYKKNSLCFFAFLLPAVMILTGCHQISKPNKPNVIIVMTDDQGIGDLSYHGNPYLKTPNLDKFAAESTGLSNFHVSPLCTPTRSAIITGQYPVRNGAWATFKGRDAIQREFPTIADVFRAQGYHTAHFGKWHLGDNFPVRPTDVGFDHSLQHLSGGVGELSDYWGNTYFNDTYFENNQPKKFTGYCTDVWFQETIRHIENHQNKPFFIYLATNAPHSPLIVADKYKQPYEKYEGKQIISAAYLGMIANIDENFGKLDQYLKESGLADNTILIFMTDNGTQYGYSYEKNMGFNKGFRGNKSNKEEGGHRVPFYIRWPKGGIEAGFESNQLAAHVDLLPTLAQLCDFTPEETAYLDGIDLSEILLQKKKDIDRSVFIHHRQDPAAPDDWQGSAILKNEWRLLHGKKLYHITEDSLQLKDIYQQQPEMVAQLKAENEAFMKATKTAMPYQQLPAPLVGHPEQEEVVLTIQHAMGTDRGIWKSEQVAEGMKNTNNRFALDVHRKGKYQISCRRWPKECPGKIWGVPAENPKNHFQYRAIKPEKVNISIGTHNLVKSISEEDEAIDCIVELEKGRNFLTADFIEGNEKYGVYYIYISAIPSNS
ncbi:arylsulfatase [Persicobacter diffluens]|uniref:N-acetylgalactosamine-6-sulfatase n=1 Tax=Persicobacter diffluens TaxID=981 RepID=A0AAN4VVZ7_9BACT|nr:N-acetylgalactosamine-6-sulfatase [Persicobacter diffluens]